MNFWETMRGEKLISILTRYIPQMITKQYVLEVDDKDVITTIVSEIEKGSHYITKFENSQTAKTLIIFEKSAYS